MARQPEGSAVQRALVEQYRYDGEETCAADGSCRLACPVAIDTGKLIKDLRIRSHSERAERRALRMAQRWSPVERAARVGLRTSSATARFVGDAPLRAVTGAARRIAGDELVPQWIEAMPGAAPGRLPRTSRDGAAAVYLPACINRIFGTSRKGEDVAWLPQALVDVSARAGLPVWIPPDAPGHCCATPWSSKGFSEGHRHMARHLFDAVWRWTDGGSLPLVIDATSCALGIGEDVPPALSDDQRERFAVVEVIDAISWARDSLLPKLEIRHRVGSAAVHPNCSARELGLGRPLQELAAALAEEAVVPLAATCCGMAGDRGLLHPELVAAATAEEAAEVGERSFDAHLSANRTCEIALEQATGRPYMSVIQLLDQVTRG
jgi:D-lactate dehydrogenase